MSTVVRLIRNVVMVVLLLAIVGVTGVATAQEQAKVAVIDVQRLLTDSSEGKVVLENLRQAQDVKVGEAEQMQTRLQEIQSQIAQGRLSLSEERLQELAKEAQDLEIAFRRFQTDADRQLQEQRDTEFGKIERKIMPIIEQYGKEQGFTMILNKFQSGLLFADEQIDITPKILERLDGTAAPDAG